MARIKRQKSTSRPTPTPTKGLTQEQLQILQHAASVPNVPISDLVKILKSFGSSRSPSPSASPSPSPPSSSALSSQPNLSENNHSTSGGAFNSNPVGASSTVLSSFPQEPYNGSRGDGTAYWEADGEVFDLSVLDNATLDDFSAFLTDNIPSFMSQPLSGTLTAPRAAPELCDFSQQLASTQNPLPEMYTYAGYAAEIPLGETPVPQSLPVNNSHLSMYSAGEVPTEDSEFVLPHAQVHLSLSLSSSVCLTPAMEAGSNIGFSNNITS